MNSDRPFSSWLQVIIITLGLVIAPTLALAQRPIGIDVSDYQSASINWATLKNTYNISFAWAKASEGTSSGSGSGGGNFPTYNANAKAAGVIIGAYHYARYDLHAGTSGATSEANVFWNAIKTYTKTDGLTLMPMLDVEASFTNQTKATITAWVNQWCLTVSNNAATAGLKLKPCVYISSSKAATYLDSTVNQWNTDIASWYSNHATAESSAQGAGTPIGGITPWTTWQFWQYDDQNVAQALTTGDGDIFNGTLAQLTNNMVVKPLGPVITTQPVTITAVEGANASFTVAATGSGTIHYQWQFNGTNIATATASRLTLTNIVITNGGGYSVALTDSIGTTPSSTAYLNVQIPLVNAAGSIVAPTGMVNWWPADGSANDIFGTANCLPQGGFYYAPGESGTAFHFDGSTGLMTNGAANLAVPWTLSMWVNRQDSPQTSAILMSDGTYSLKLEQYNGTHQVGLTILGVGDYVFSPAYTVPIGTWTHLAFVGTSSGTSLYANGIYKGSLTNIPLPRKFIGAAYITSSAKYVDFMLGSLDEIMTFNRALSASEISAIYSSGSAGMVRAPQIVSSLSSGPNQMTLKFKGQTGKNYTLYSSTNLIDWISLGNVANTLGTNQYIDTSATNDQEFYRLSQTY
ncbi:GH25 family lysozyme [Pedosphaera parvula]|uniref:Glycoside hydrolase family 25 n=1 Tax=Pedosphaera parvula (strain Ellin514) TaxID=320771 RepID=B9XKQ4_PEDPL|nr:GH25 family lysozyme [Pedosphaera parvula]EEF59547.1 glycoside hydrolase family 25 [Pedosphaera parvula Ellin514]